MESPSYELIVLAHMGLVVVYAVAAGHVAAGGGEGCWLCVRIRCFGTLECLALGWRRRASR